MIKSYKYKIKPTKIQSNQLDRFFGCTRFIYNWGLDRDINAAINIKQIGLDQSKEIKLPQVNGSPDCGEFLR
jgi:transposase